MGRLGRVLDGVIRHKRVRHVDRRNTGCFHECQAGIVHGLGMHAVAVSGLYGSFAMDLSDQIAQHAPLLSMLNPGATDYESVLRHSVLRQFPPVLCHGGRIGCDELGLSWYGDRSVEEQRYGHL